MNTPCSFVFTATTKSGKSTLVRDLLLNHYQMFDKPLDEVVWLYHKNAVDEQFMSHLKNNLNIPIRFLEGFRADEISNGTLFKSKGLKCLVLDDVVVSALRSPVFMDLFTVISHHQSMVVIAILQNVHADTPSQRQIMNNVIRNLSFLVLFPDRRQMNACKQIARTYFGGEEDKLLKPFKYLIDNKEKYNYMLIDFDSGEVRFNCLRPTDKPFKFENMEKRMLKMETLPDMLERKLETNDDGNIIFPGDDDVAQRTGSNLNHLIDYSMGKSKEKPIDYNAFCILLTETLKIPADKLHKKD